MCLHDSFGAIYVAMRSHTDEYGLLGNQENEIEFCYQ